MLGKKGLRIARRWSTTVLGKRDRKGNPADTPADFPERTYMDRLGFPGEWPYTRGVHATGHRGRLWTMRMFAGFGNAEETNERFRYLLALTCCPATRASPSCA